ncbi:CPBP family intramembrane metalloprotease [Pseudonocardia kongjuensis]|uniref:CPBP family intramembrane metalloprotease n=1 Tax=Pseudonocardia kongjuensis TaxID=102227 RepID=A0ABP4IUK2_9PSEU
MSTGRWLALWSACLVAFLVLSLVPLDGPSALVRQSAFTAIMLGALGWATGRWWTALFRRVTLRDAGLMVVFAVLGMITSGVAALVVRSLFAVSANPLSGGTRGGTGQTIVEWVGDAVQLLGEELMTLLPFLALLHILTGRAGLGRRPAIVWAALVTAVWFGALHLPTYDWNVAQSLIVIGAARLVLTLAYIRTKNLWVPVGAHILFDTTVLFLVPALT